MTILPYDRNAAVRYAKTWALSRNPQYYDFSKIGGDCTNFVSQCIFAGAGIMNPNDWYYYNLQSRSASWTSVQYLYQFLTTNKGKGPFCAETAIKDLLPGDVIQLGRNDGTFYHSLLITQMKHEILVCAHSEDWLNRPLKTYVFRRLRGLHIQGIQK